MRYGAVIAEGIGAFLPRLGPDDSLLLVGELSATRPHFPSPEIWQTLSVSFRTQPDPAVITPQGECLLTLELMTPYFWLIDREP